MVNRLKHEIKNTNRVNRSFETALKFIIVKSNIFIGQPILVNLSFHVYKFWKKKVLGASEITEPNILASHSCTYHVYSNNHYQKKITIEHTKKETQRKTRAKIFVFSVKDSYFFSVVNLLIPN